MIILNRLPFRRVRLSLCSQDGSALVETALTFPVLVLMLLGAVQLGQVAFAATETANAARAGVQYAAMNGGGYNDSAGITLAAQADAGDTTGLTATPSSSCACSDGSTCTGASGVYSCSPPSPGAATPNPVVTVSVSTTATYSALIKIPGMSSSYTLHGWAQQQVLK